MSFITDLLNRIKHDQPTAGIPHFTYEADDDGLSFFLPKEQFDALTKGDGEPSPKVVFQYTILQGLEEQGEAERIPNGFIVPSETVCRLDQDHQTLFELPPLYQELITTQIKSRTEKPDFSVTLEVYNQNGLPITSFQLNGPLLVISDAEFYLLSSWQLAVFKGNQQHQMSSKTTFDNIKLMQTLSNAKSHGTHLSLSHFESLTIKEPVTVPIIAEIQPNGDANITPFLGQNADPDKINQALGQLNHSSALRINDDIILLDEDRIAAVKEIIENQHIPKEQVKSFFNNPAAFIDASMINLDDGFCQRIKGATLFKHAYFGETEESGISWFGEDEGESKLKQPGALYDLIESQEDLTHFKSLYEQASKTGSSVLGFKGEDITIANADKVSTTLLQIDTALKEGISPKTLKPETHSKTKEPEEPTETIVVDIDLYDDERKNLPETLTTSIEAISEKSPLDLSNYHYTPLKHQDVGIRWLLGLSQQDTNGKQNGGLLADDMGLGKTFMSLAFIDQYYKKQSALKRLKKPALVVVPLSLIDVWADEITNAFITSPFKDIVKLQADSDLKRFKKPIENHTKKEADGAETKNTVIAPKHNLKVGKDFGHERLDLPERLIITTYETLRDYQFSLCEIPFSIVVFDEAQNIKNPNTLVTRAAKGLSADFRLVATGTPVENSLRDFWCLMNTARPDCLDDYQSFRQAYISPILQSALDEIDEIRERTGAALRAKVGALMLRRTKEDSLEGLPKKHIYSGITTHNHTYLESLDKTMQGYQLDVYDQALISQRDDEENQALKTLHRLRNISLHPQLMDQGQLLMPKDRESFTDLIQESEKMLSLFGTLDAIKTQGEKCIVFCINKRLQSFLSVALADHFKLPPVTIINGDTKAVAKNKHTKTRKTLIKDFEAKAGFNVIIMSPVAAGVGLTVVGANHVIHYERHWNPAKEAQATDRIYRIGQEKPVHVYFPVLKHPHKESFDENLHKLLSQKTLLKDAVVTQDAVAPNPEGFDDLECAPNMQITVENVNKLSWLQFEAFAVELLRKTYDCGDAHLTKNGNDYGADGLLNTQDGLILIQAKLTGHDTFSGHKAVQEVYAAQTTYANAFGGKPIIKCIVFTNARNLTTKAREFAKEHKVEIINGNAIKNLLDQHPVIFKEVLSRLAKARFAP